MNSDNEVYQAASVSWIRLDVNFLEHPKVDALSDGAKLLHIWGICYAGRQLSDGFIPKNQIKTARKLKLLNELLANSLWHEVAGGFEIHDYLEHQSSRSRVEEARDHSREGMAKLRADRKGYENVKPNKADGYENVSRLEVEVEVEVEKDLTTTDLVPRGLEESSLLANLLADLIAENGSKRPKVSKTWITDIDKMTRIDRHSVSEVRAMIEWCQHDSFWRANILSPAKLRLKYDQMRLKAESQNRASQPKGLNVILEIRAEEESKLFQIGS